MESDAIARLRNGIEKHVKRARLTVFKRKGMVLTVYRHDGIKYKVEKINEDADYFNNFFMICLELNLIENI